MVDIFLRHKTRMERSGFGTWRWFMSEPEIDSIGCGVTLKMRHCGRNKSFRSRRTARRLPTGLCVLETKRSNGIPKYWPMSLIGVSSGDRLAETLTMPAKLSSIMRRAIEAHRHSPSAISAWGNSQACGKHCGTNPKQAVIENLRHFKALAETGEIPERKGSPMGRVGLWPGLKNRCMAKNSHAPRRKSCGKNGGRER